MMKICGVSLDKYPKEKSKEMHARVEATKGIKKEAEEDDDGERKPAARRTTRKKQTARRGEPGSSGSEDEEDARTRKLSNTKGGYGKIF